MADRKLAYGAKTAITVTLTSLANAAARESTVVDNTVNKYLDARVRVKTNGLAGGGSSLDVYVYSALSDTSYSDGATGTDAAFTAANRLNSKYLDSVVLNGATAVVAELRSIAACFGGIMPSKWGLIFVNRTGQALSATAGDHVIEYQGMYETIV